MIEYLVRIMADGRQIDAASTSASRSLKQIEDSAHAAGGAIAKAMAAGSAARGKGGEAGAGGLMGWAAGGLAAMGKRMLPGAGALAAYAGLSGAMNTAGELKDIADQTQLSTEQLQRWQYAAEQAGLSLGDLIQGFQGFRIAQQAAMESPDGDQAKALKSVMGNISGMSSMPQGDLFEVYLDTLAKRGRGPDNLSAVRSLFGGQGERLMRVGAAGLRTTGEKAPIIGASALDRLDSTGDLMNKVKFEVRAGVLNSGSALVDAIRDTTSFPRPNPQSVWGLLQTSNDLGSLRTDIGKIVDHLNMIEANTKDTVTRVKDSL